MGSECPPPHGADRTLWGAGRPAGLHPEGGARRVPGLRPALVYRQEVKRGGLGVPVGVWGSTNGIWGVLMGFGVPQGGIWGSTKRI